MHDVYLGVGSNIDSEHHIRYGVTALQQLFGRVGFSSVYRSPAVGFDGAPFLNLVVRVETDRQLGELAITLKTLEYRYGRTLNSTKCSSRRLDIDILTFDNYHGVYGGIKLPRPEILENAYVLCPFAELAPTLILPGQAMTLGELWGCYSNSRQPITKLGACEELFHYCEAK